MEEEESVDSKDSVATYGHSRSECNWDENRIGGPLC